MASTVTSSVAHPLALPAKLQRRVFLKSGVSSPPNSLNRTNEDGTPRAKELYQHATQTDIVLILSAKIIVTLFNRIVLKFSDYCQSPGKRNEKCTSKIREFSKFL